MPKGVMKLSGLPGCIGLQIAIVMLQLALGNLAGLRSGQRIANATEAFSQPVQLNQ